MKLLTRTLFTFLIAAPAVAQEGSGGAATPAPARSMSNAVNAVAPALDKYSREVIFDNLWRRPGLSQRDRSIVTITVLITRNQATEMAFYFNRALDTGVTARELSEIITHLAFYAGWGDAMAAVNVAAEVFKARGIASDQLPAVSPVLLPIDVASEARRVKEVHDNVGPVSPGLEQYTSVPLFTDLWLRPDLKPRDRSLVTVTALMATSQTAQMASHMNRGMDNGLTQVELSEVIPQVAFYAGWPKAFSAIPVARDVFAGRAKKM